MSAAGGLPDFRGRWLEHLEMLNERRANKVYEIIEREGWPVDRQSSLQRAYEEEEVRTIDDDIEALKRAYATDPEGEPPTEWPGTDR